MLRQRYHWLKKSELLFFVLLACVLVGCGSQSMAVKARVGVQGQQVQSQDLRSSGGNCPAQGDTMSAVNATVAYTVSWEAVGADADADQGVSTLYVGAVDIASGRLLWKRSPVKVSAMYQSSLQQVVDGVLYIVSTDAQSTLVLAVDTRDGHALWQRTLAQNVGAALEICAGRIYLGSGGTEILTLNAGNGQTLWSYGSNNVSISDMVVTTHAVYVAEQSVTGSDLTSFSIIALSPDGGVVLWRRDQQGLMPRLVVHGSGVYVLNPVPLSSAGDPLTTPIASVQALDGESGHVLWQAVMPSNMEQISVLSTGEIVYLNGQDLVNQSQSLLVAVNASSGKLLWVRKHAYDQLTLPGDQDLYGYKGTPGDDPQTKRLFCALDSVTGEDRWCVEKLQPSLFSLSATRDMVIVEEALQPGPLTLVQNLYGLRKTDGKILWKLSWQSSSPAVQTLTLVTVLEGQGLVRQMA